MIKATVVLKRITGKYIEIYADDLGQIHGRVSR